MSQTFYNSCILKRQGQTMIVMKFGGTSVGTLEKMEHAARIVLEEYFKGSSPIVVVSAMEKETDRLVQLVDTLSLEQCPERDLVISTGETVSTGLFSLTLKKVAKKYFEKDIQAMALTSLQAGLQGSGKNGEGNLDSIDDMKIRALAAEGIIPVLPGFQCLKGSQMLTLGRGGSDTSAVVIGGLLGASKVYIYTDVDGVYDLDPKVFEYAKKYDSMNVDDLIELTRKGAKVVHPKAAEFAKKLNIPLIIKSTFFPKSLGTKICSTGVTL